jgi:hypothetical protein
MNLRKDLKAEYQEKLTEYLLEAEALFGKRTKYELVDIAYRKENTPETIMLSNDPLYGITFMVWLNEETLTNYKEGIFQLSHEVVHLLSPVEQVEGNEVNFLEEGMAVYLSKRITERECKDYDYCNESITKHPQYLEAYLRYMSLIDIDPKAIYKLRKYQAFISKLKHEDFLQAGIDAPRELTDLLLKKFDR